MCVYVYCGGQKRLTELLEMATGSHLTWVLGRAGSVCTHHGGSPAPPGLFFVCLFFNLERVSVLWNLLRWLLIVLFLSFILSVCYTTVLTEVSHWPYKDILIEPILYRGGTWCLFFCIFVTEQNGGKWEFACSYVRIATLLRVLYLEGYLKDKIL